MDLDKVMKSLAGSGFLGGLAGGAVGSALVGNKSARKVAGTALKVGGLAALGGLAYQAYQKYQSEEQGTAAVRTGGQTQEEAIWSGLTAERFAVDANSDKPGSRGLLMIQAMVAAAFADGHMDDSEREKILEQLATMELDREEKALAFEALSQPLSLQQLCEKVDCPEVAADVYLASLMAMDRTRLGADIYLEALAFRLGLPEGLVVQLNNSLPTPEQTAVA